MNFLASVIVTSALYAIMASGFVVIYRASRVLNFAYGDVILLAGYLASAMTGFIGGSSVISHMIILFAAFLFGLAIYALLIKPMAGQPAYSTIILTVAFGILMQAFTILTWRGQMKSIRLPWRAYITLFGGLRLSSTEIIIVFTAIVFFVALFSFYRFSKTGRQMRASAENPLLASQRSVNIYFVTGLAWAISIFSAGLTAILSGANYGVSLFMSHVALKAFAVALVGGLDSLRGIIPAAFLIALAELTANTYVNPRLANTIPFIIMIIVLMTRPWGFFGTEEEIERV
jgi:branched-chain amino acid transport system permease protein